MARPPVIADASALISLGWVDQLQILPALFGRIIVPPAVAAEVTRRGSTLPRWVDVRPLSRPIDHRVVAAHLGAGESEAMGLGLEIEDAWLILDMERPGGPRASWNSESSAPLPSSSKRSAPDT